MASLDGISSLQRDVRRRISIAVFFWRYVSVYCRKMYISLHWNSIKHLLFGIVDWLYLWKYLIFLKRCEDRKSALVLFLYISVSMYVKVEWTFVRCWCSCYDGVGERDWVIICLYVCFVCFLFCLFLFCSVLFLFLFVSFLSLLL